jgi:hypothetical protein
LAQKVQSLDGGGDDGGGVEPVELIVTWTFTVMADWLVLTLNDAEYVPAAKVDAKLTVTWFDPVPLVGETLSQEAVGVEIDHFSEPLPELLMFTVCEGTAAPASACTTIDVGETESCPCADARAEKIRRLRTQRNRLINTDAVRIELLG